MSTVTEDFTSHHRHILSEFRSLQLDITKQEHDFKEWSSRFSTTHNSGSPTRSPTRKLQSATPEGLNPGAIEVELKDFKELFSKLKVTYLEQETKETFLRVILDEDEEEPKDESGNRKGLRVWKIGQTDLDEATERNGGLKQALVDKKKELQQVSDVITDLVGEVCDRYEMLKKEVTEAENMLLDMESMQEELKELESSEEAASQDVHQTLPLKETLDLYESLKAQQLGLDNDINELANVIIPEKKFELEKAGSELVNLSEIKKRIDEVAKLTVEARKIEVKHGKVVAKENIGRWYSNVLYILKRLLSIDNVHIDHLNEQVTLRFKNSKDRIYEVKLSFTNGRFYNATMISPTSLDIARVVDRAVQSNDIRYFIEELKLMVEL
ncbi:hypothetical protein V1525DRAFT_394171 [Lipomyces kononenkoae]|uniref:Uncharacterized protein n=1 Tax=Lipomyces kononenkoae TaxID=34357 RepID=A0ACC3TAD6_LIPKO